MLIDLVDNLIDDTLCDADLQIGVFPPAVNKDAEPRVLFFDRFGDRTTDQTKANKS